MSKDLGSKFLIEEGLEDLDDIKNGFNRWIKSLELDTHSEGRLREKLKLKERAKSLGLTYWPALYGKWDIDPMAYVYAERILTAKTGEVWGTYKEEVGGQKSRGGWDSEEHHGISARMVKRMWYSAGCANNTKFQLQVEFGFVVGKRWNRHQTLEVLKGKRWLANNRSFVWRYTERACWMLGRLSAPLRRVAIGPYCGRTYTYGRPIKSKDLDWTTVSKVQKDRIYNPKLDIILSGETRAKELLGISNIHEHDTSLSATFYPQYGELPWRMVQELSTGTTPVELSEGHLTKKEAHQWLVTGVKAGALEWYLDKYELPYVREWQVAKWLKYLKTTNRWAAMEKERTQYHPERGEIKFSYVMLLDEIMADDIHTTTDSVASVMERLHQRQEDGYTSKFWEDHQPLVDVPKWVSKLPEGVRYLNTPAALVREGKQMEHCVGTYVSVVRNGSCHILSITTPEGRSTVEFNKGVTNVVQHRGKGNLNPPAANVEVLEEVRQLLAG